MTAFPFLVLVLAIVAMLGPGLTNFYIAISLVSWVAYARIVRGEALSARGAGTSWPPGASATAMCASCSATCSRT